jgi:hypothetical protein
LINVIVRISLISIAISGIITPTIRFEINAPPIKAIAAMGVKFGQCGNKRKKEAMKIAERTRRNLGWSFFIVR